MAAIIIDLTNTSGDEEEPVEVEETLNMAVEPPFPNPFNNSNLIFDFTFAGPPRALPRMRRRGRFGGGFFNPAKKELLTFKAKAKSAIGQQQLPLVPKGQTVSMVVTFFMKRRKSDFTSGCRSSGLKQNVSSAPPMIPDIDNLIKLVLDALNGVVYYDDGQVSSILSTKTRDNVGGCLGRTQVQVYLN